MRRAVVVLFLLLLWVGGAFAAPPTIDVRPALGDALIQGHWQPLVVMLKNPDTGEPLQGEVQVAVQDLRSSALLASYIKQVTLPRGAGETRVALDLYVPDGVQPEIMVYVVSGRDGKGEVATRKRFDKLPVRADPLTLVAVTQTPDALAYLQGEGLGVQRVGGVLRPATATSAPGVRSRGSGYEEPVKVQHLSDPANLPDRTLGYDVASVVYVGPDIPPAALSDSQVETLRLWVFKGGLLVFSNAKLRTDERFRPWLPSANAAERFSTLKVGRGTTIGLAYDPAMPDYAGTPGAVQDWKQVVRAGTASLSIGEQVQEDTRYGSGMTFQQSVMRAPGMQAPGIGAIGLFLVSYILLLVPINYLILKRLDKREWTWITVPVLVGLFSLGAYWFGLSTKGSQTIQNAATLVEMTASSGDTLTSGVVGVFSPSKTRYRIGADIPDAMLWDVSNGYRGNSEYGPLAVQERDKQGALIRDAEISMWAMRAFNVRAHTLRLGDGIIANLSMTRKREPSTSRNRRRRLPDEVVTLTGTIENRTGKRLENVRVLFMGGVVALNNLDVNQKVPVKLTVNPRLNSGNADLLGNADVPHVDSQGSKLTIEQTKNAIRYDVVNAVRDQLSSRNGNTNPLTQVLIAAWNFDPLLPITVNNEKVPTGANVNLVLCTAPVTENH